MFAICSLAAAFVVPTPLARSAVAPCRAAPVMTDIPRIELPSVVTDVLKDVGVKNPNELDTTAYNEYSAAAIGGTLLFFILPIFDITGFFGDLIFSALFGGGLLAYAALSDGPVGEYGNKFGGLVMKGVDEGFPAVKSKVEELIKSVTG